MSEIETLGDRWLRGLLSPLIVEDSSGRLVFFNRYTVQQIGETWQVFNRNSGKKNNFSSRRNAAAWCILDRWGHYVEALQVANLDSRLNSLDTHMEIHKTLSKSKNVEVAAINRAKLVECIYHRKQFRWELNKYINLADTSQQRGFQNELTRTSRKQKNGSRS